ncbi:hypothetical protein OROHE_005517 [Orobanche hederae]
MFQLVRNQIKAEQGALELLRFPHEAYTRGGQFTLVDT